MHIVPSEAKLGVFHQEIGWLDADDKLFTLGRTTPNGEVED